MAKYLQLANRTMITVIGIRWSKGLMVTVSAQFVPGISNVETQAFWSVKPIV